MSEQEDKSDQYGELTSSSGLSLRVRCADNNNKKGYIIIRNFGQRTDLLAKENKGKLNPSLSKGLPIDE